MKQRKMKRILIYRLGSLGDTIIALPCFHLIAHTFPDAKRYLLGDLIANVKASHASAILCDSGIVQHYLSYPVGLRSPGELVKLRRKIKALQPDILIYLAASRGRTKAIRDVFFFKCCGIKKIIGVPYATLLQENQWLDDKQCYEYEANRLARCLTDLGSAKLDDPQSWNLHLTYGEKERAREVLGNLGKNIPFIVCSVGAKVDAKNWGIANWENLTERLSRRYKRFALVFVGAKDEYDLCEQVGRSWAGEKLNLSGRLTPRESSAVLKKATLFIGHDSGPMHLAAAVGTPCVCIFSGRNKPKVWFPYGDNHRVIYHEVGCNGCGLLDVCEREAKKCITSITTDEVLDEVAKTIGCFSIERMLS